MGIANGKSVLDNLETINYFSTLMLHMRMFIYTNSQKELLISKEKILEHVRARYHFFVVITSQVRATMGRLLQDLALYKKFRDKEVASAARGLISLFRELAPGMLEKRDRGRDADLDAAPLAFGARLPADRVEGADLLQAALQRGDEASSSEGEEIEGSESAGDDLEALGVEAEASSDT